MTELNRILATNPALMADAPPDIADDIAATLPCRLTFKGWDDGIDWHECATHHADVIGHHVPCEHGTHIEEPTADCDHPADPDAPRETAGDYLPLHDGVRLSVYFGETDGVPVVQIDTDEDAGRLRINLNDGPVWDGDPETDAAPGRYFEPRDVPDPRDDALDRIAEAYREVRDNDLAAWDALIPDLARILAETGRTA